MKTEVLDKITELVTIAFGLVAALVWNAAILAIFEQVLGTAAGVGPLISYAVIVTIAAVAATIALGRASQRARQMMDEKPETTNIRKAA